MSDKFNENTYRNCNYDSIETNNVGLLTFNSIRLTYPKLVILISQKIIQSVSVLFKEVFIIVILCRQFNFVFFIQMDVILTFILALVVVSAPVPLTNFSLNDHWKTFKKNYEKEYDKHEEEFQRFISSFFLLCLLFL